MKADALMQIFHGKFHKGFAMNLTEILSENITKRRKKLGISQASLAERLHITPEAMTRIEKGQNTPKFTRLESLARNLQCTVPALFRPYSDDNQDRAAIILDSLAGLPDDAQDALVNLVLQASRVISQQYVQKP